MGGPPKNKLLRAMVGMYSAGGSEVMWRKMEQDRAQRHSDHLNRDVQIARRKAAMAAHNAALPRGGYKPGAGAGTRLLR